MREQWYLSRTGKADALLRHHGVLRRGGAEGGSLSVVSIMITIGRDLRDLPHPGLSDVSWISAPASAHRVVVVVVAVQL